MTDLADVVAVTINDHAISLYDLLRGLKVRGRQDFLEEALKDHLLAEAAIQEGIDISDDELQTAVDRFRQRAGLASASATTVWLEQNRLTIEDIADRLKRQLRNEKLKQKLTRGEEERYFENNKEDFEMAAIGQVSFDEPTAADSFADLVRGAGADFYALAASRSEDFLARFPRCVGRDDLPAAIEAAVFGAETGEVVGPVRTGSEHHVIKLEGFHLASLTDDLKARIRDNLFEDWHADLLRRAQIDVALTDLL